MTINAHKVLIANRGEIAVRIIRACQDYGVQSVAVYAEPDCEALYVSMADEAWALPGVSASETYLNIEALLRVARCSGATMVHPGYGFLSERGEFARAVQAAGLIWIGPSPETIEQLGNKVEARKIALAVGAPLVTGSSGPVRGADEAIAFATQHGLPIAIKAAFGGGGRGLKVARELDEISELYQSATREALHAFGRAECYVEQFIDRPRHIEAQVIADNFGQIVILGTRDCSLQRRNQKLVEEAPAPFISDSQQQQIQHAAEAICRHVNYVSAGTVEFLLGRDGKLSFLEVNTRLQVEHPVTEEVTGFDIVVEQLRIADGLPLSIQHPPVPRGHAFEFRINAEDAGKGYLPTPGTLSAFHPPAGPGIRLDSGVVSGSTVPGQYDSLLAKLIVTGQTREQAVHRARRALREFSIAGVATLLPFHRAVMNDTNFTENFNVHTRWIETEFQGEIPPAARQKPAINEGHVTHSWIELDGRRIPLGLPASLFSGLVPQGAGQPDRISADPAAARENRIEAPMSGQLFRWLVEEGEEVQTGQGIAIMEAMKMEVQVIAQRSGVIKQRVSPGSQLQAGEVIGVIDPQ